ncbi:Cobyrinic acid A,C-diamide synthase [Candidatus Rhodobacter oscarellae]|uniref:Hydrogenobyrinate a,c-diamide synthase n=1 Tax=Candidatus Rhodobacter oscarellae TaxID=1675527 RepID=A0A0J9E3Y8_9RHOB|nr:cobyrinate a,c-diamide synthase [Candidatus Rhodobacter lobularis]KMW57521.1 Cobyrinic acid A,C-diamide synthase [Candidatus Rhodobacter lobularis]
MPGRGLILAAASSGAGKTTVTLGLLRALRRQGVAVRGAKSGPDYIDPRFHEAATGLTCMNLDAWAMTPERIKSLAAGDGLLIVEGAMGLFDGAPPDGRGATADLARILGLPVVLVVDAARMSQSVAPLVAGFAAHDPRVRIAGVILNRVGSDRHERMLRAALAPLGLPVFGVLRRSSDLALPDRHLGLVQAEEHPALEAFLNTAADHVATGVDLDGLEGCAMPLPTPKTAPPEPLFSHESVAVAHDRAFAFLYPHLVADWQKAGTRIKYFSPLANEPVPEADLVYLPGGYPELHAGRLANAERFLGSLRSAAQNSDIYGECGGYMVLGEALTDAEGNSHEMAGLLGLHTSFAARELHLGYRNLTSRSAHMPGTFAAHEFHYATTLRADGDPLFEATDAEGQTLPPMGLVAGRVSGSFAHVIVHR